MLVQTRLPDTDDARRERIFAGGVLAMEATAASTAFCAHAWDLICEAFDPLDPRDAQDRLAVERFVEIVAALKPRYTHSVQAKELLAGLIASYGCDPGETYFDLPKLRIVTHSAYLTAGVGYAYKPHRDVWYSCPPSQNNWWVPITATVAENALAFFPAYWDTPVENSSADFDAFEWNSNGRASAAQHVKSDTRNHPQLIRPVDLSQDLRILGGPASTLIFSAAHLHATVPNTSGTTRFSIDFRTAHLADLEAQRGAHVIDSRSTGSTIHDFRNAADRSPVPERVAKLYDDEAAYRGALVYSPPSA